MKNIALIIAAIILLSGCEQMEKTQTVIFHIDQVGINESIDGSDHLTLEISQEECVKIHQELRAYMDGGWKVVSSRPKRIIVDEGLGLCIGTEYILEK